MRAALIIFCAIFLQHHEVTASPTKVVRLTLPAKVLLVEPEPAEVIEKVVTPTTTATPAVEDPVPVTTEESTSTTTVPIPNIVVNSTEVGTEKHKVTYVVDADKELYIVRWGGCGYKGLCG